jgi:hypothetical protein
MARVCSKQVEIDFVSPQSREGFVQVKLRYILTSPVWGKGVWSTHVEMHFVSLSRDGFVQHKLSFILCPHCHGRGLVNIG